MTDQEKDNLRKLCRFCAYRERAKAEVVEKLLDWEVSFDKHQMYLDFLINEKFIDENRFAEYYVHGKLHNNKWGRNKIRAGLYERNVDKKAIDKGMSTIKKREYLKILKKLIATKLKTVKGKTDFEKNTKIGKYLIQKGFESSLVWDTIKQS